MIEDVRLKHKRARWFHTRDHGGGLNLSKASLGEFLYEALKRGCQIGNFFALNANYPRSFVQASIFGNFFALNANYPRSFVQASIFMTDEMKEAFEAETRFKFQDPPRITLNTAM